MCLYETKKSSLFNKHLESCSRGSGNMQFKNVSRFYTSGHVNQKWAYRVQFVRKGLNLFKMVKICVLCKHICVTIKELKQHLENTHCEFKKETTQFSKMCTCGEVFPITILLKHHVFKMGGDHQALDLDTGSDSIEVIVPARDEDDDY